MQRTRPVILTAMAAVLAFIPLTHSVFWGSMAYTLIGGTAVGTVLILLFLPALYAAWFRIKPHAKGARDGAENNSEGRATAAGDHGSTGRGGHSMAQQSAFPETSARPAA